ncbi:MAG: hypothetical protein V7K57_07640 [Nostoc sp.]|uniref:hypothetical protein n=1 Tax=Nostoc sp. TaxID=1180 RepID=UPI002FFB8EF0
MFLPILFTSGLIVVGYAIAQEVDGNAYLHEGAEESSNTKFFPLCPQACEKCGGNHLWAIVSGRGLCKLKIF